MLLQGRSLGRREHLVRKLDYIWRSITDNILDQAELFRLTRGLETARSQLWGAMCLVTRNGSGYAASATDYVRLRQRELCRCCDIHLDSNPRHENGDYHGYHGGRRRAADLRLHP